MSDDSAMSFDSKEWAEKMRSTYSTRVRVIGNNMNDFGARLVYLARQFCPRDTDRLYGAIFYEPVKWNSNGSIASIRFGVDLQHLLDSPTVNTSHPNFKIPTKNYAKYPEYGTSKMGAKPFIRPAIAQAKSEFGPIMSKGV